MDDTNESQSNSNSREIPVADTVFSSAPHVGSTLPGSEPPGSELLAREPALVAPAMNDEPNYESEDGFYPLDPRMIQVELIGGVIFTLIALVGFLIGLAIGWANVGFTWIFGAAVIAGIVMLGICLYFTAFWPAKAYAHASWRLDDEGLEIRRGVLWRHQISIPLGRVQHADVSQGPLQRMYEIGKLTVHTAGTQNASVELDGLTHAVALDLRDLLVKQRKTSNVV